MLSLFNVMKEFAKEFYSSKAWQDCRRAYKKSVGGLCEICLKQGRYSPGEIVHHRVHLTPLNISNPLITLNWNNLQCVCRECHASIHGHQQGRYVIEPDGNIRINE